MAIYLDLDDCAAGNPVAEKELKKLRAEKKLLCYALEDMIIYTKALEIRAGESITDINIGARNHAKSILFAVAGDDFELTIR